MSLFWAFFFAYVVWGQTSCASIKVMVKLLTGNKMSRFGKFNSDVIERHTKKMIIYQDYEHNLFLNLKIMED